MALLLIWRIGLVFTLLRAVAKFYIYLFSSGTEFERSIFPILSTLLESVPRCHLLIELRDVDFRMALATAGGACQG